MPLSIGQVDVPNMWWERHFRRRWHTAAVTSRGAQEQAQIAAELRAGHVASHSLDLDGNDCG